MAFKEQMAGQNSLLLLTHLALSIMESQLRAAAADVDARRVQVSVPVYNLRSLHKLAHTSVFATSEVAGVGKRDNPLRCHRITTILPFAETLRLRSICSCKQKSELPLQP